MNIRNKKIYNFTALSVITNILFFMYITQMPLLLAILLVLPFIVLAYLVITEQI